MDEKTLYSYQIYLGAVARDLTGCISSRRNKYTILPEGTQQSDATLQTTHLMNYNNIDSIDILVQEGMKRFAKQGAVVPDAKGTFYVIHRKIDTVKALDAVKSAINSLMQNELRQNIPARKKIIVNSLRSARKDVETYKSKGMTGRIFSRNPAGLVDAIEKELKGIESIEKEYRVHAASLDSQKALVECWSRLYPGKNLCMVEHICRYEDGELSYSHILSEHMLTDDLVKSKYKGMNVADIPYFLTELCKFSKFRMLGTKDPKPEFFEGIKRIKIYDFISKKEF